MTHKKRSVLAALFCAGLMLAASLIAASPAGATTSSRSAMTADNCAPLTTANDNWLDAVYEWELGRCIDSSGLAAWSAALAQGTSRTRIVQIIDFSAESLGNDVTWAYQYWLGRTPNADEIAYWSQFITPASGGDDVMWAGVSASNEAYAYYLSETDNDTVQADQDWISDVYGFFLDRGIEEDEEAQTFWMSYIENGALIGSGPDRASTYSARYAMVRSLLVSDEQARYYVNDVYSNVLDRSADSNGAAFWFSWFQKTHDYFGLYEHFLASNEFFNDAQTQSTNARRAGANTHPGVAGRSSQSRGAQARSAS
jgi:hypothetical protein